MALSKVLSYGLFLILVPLLVEKAFALASFVARVDATALSSLALCALLKVSKKVN